MPDIKQFTEVVQTHHNNLRYFIRSLGTQSAWVDDIAQETFLLAYRKWNELDETENAGAWLRAIARNLVMNEITKTNRRQRLIDENLTTLLLDSESEMENPGSTEERNLRSTALGECLDKLPERNRNIIRARYFENRNSSEIGGLLRIQPANIRKILYTSRQILADCLHGKAIHEAR